MKLNLTCLLLTLFAACTFTTKRIKNPQFASSAEKLSETMGQLISCKHINLNGLEVTSNGKTTSQMEIDIINGKDIPTDTVQMRRLGKSIASIVKSNLRDVDEYDNYQVLFMTVDSSSMVTTRKWTGMTYQSEELVVKKQKDPVFAGSVDSLYQKLATLLHCEKFSTGGWMIANSHESSSVMYIEVINSTYISKDDDRLKAMGKIVAGDFKRALADTTEYGMYKVKFVSEQGDSSVGKSTILTFRSYEL